MLLLEQLFASLAATPPTVNANNPASASTSTVFVSLTFLAFSCFLAKGVFKCPVVSHGPSECVYPSSKQGRKTEMLSLT